VFDLDKKICQLDVLLEKKGKNDGVNYLKIYTEVSKINELNTNRLERAKSVS
jgi:hypothetical protein